MRDEKLPCAVRSFWWLPLIYCKGPCCTGVPQRDLGLTTCHAEFFGLEPRVMAHVDGQWRYATW